MAFLNAAMSTSRALLRSCGWKKVGHNCTRRVIVAMQATLEKHVAGIEALESAHPFKAHGTDMVIGWRLLENASGRHFVRIPSSIIILWLKFLEQAVDFVWLGHFLQGVLILNTY